MADLEQYYKDYYKENGYTLEQWGNYSRAQFLKKFILENTEPDASVLDIGCGDAHLATLIPDRDYFGIDINVDKAKTKRARYHDITQIPYEYQDKFFDCVVISEVLEHMVDPVAILKEAHRILKDNGTLIVSTPNYNWIDYKLFPQQYSVAYRANLAHTWEHIRHYDPESWQHLLAQSNFVATNLVGCDAHFSPFFSHARNILLKRIFGENMDFSQGAAKQTENLTLVDMLLGECFPFDSHTIMLVCKKREE